MVEKTKAGKVTKTQWLEISKDSKPEEWEYYTEGKEHVVCRYKGQNMKYTQFILRIQKMTQLKIAESYLGIERQLYRRLFTDTVYTFPALRPFLPIIKNVKATKDYLCKMKELIAPLRPEERKMYSIDEKNTNVTIISNYFFFRHMTKNPVITIELRPKSGVTEPVGSVVQGIIKEYADFEEKFPELYTQLLEGKLSDSTFKQIQRLKNRKIDTIIEYDPDDLYSLEAERIKKVLKQFLENPQSFYRFECSDKAITSISEENLDILIAFIVQTQVLKRIQDIQKISGESIFEINGALQGILADKKACKSAKSCVEIAFERITKEEGASALKAIKKKTFTESLIQTFTVKDKRKEEVREKDNIISWIRILKYLIYSSAKDFSVMISFADVSDIYQDINMIYLDHNEFVMEKEAKIYIAKIGIIDFDPKNIKSVEHYYQERIQFVEGFISYHMKPPHLPPLPPAA